MAAMVVQAHCRERSKRRSSHSTQERSSCGASSLTMRSSGPARSKLLARPHIPAAQAA